MIGNQDGGGSRSPVAEDGPLALRCLFTLVMAWIISSSELESLLAELIWSMRLLSQIVIWSVVKDGAEIVMDRP